ncbi:hypothetical protein CB1_000327046 [Camelus ferus]|nr:hypothetical protein CB1_000327046 [Camelus ferus]
MHGASQASGQRRPGASVDSPGGQHGQSTETPPHLFQGPWEWLGQDFEAQSPRPAPPRRLPSALCATYRLLEAGALGPGITDSLGAGLVHHATRAGHLACVKFLVQRAKLPGNQRAHNGATPVHDAAATGSLAELCWLVRDGGCCLQDQDASGVSPLHLAARFGHPVLVEWLLREGHAATLETLEGALPLHHAAVSGDLTCLKLLVAAHGRPRYAIPPL